MSKQIKLRVKGINTLRPSVFDAFSGYLLDFNYLISTGEFYLVA